MPWTQLTVSLMVFAGTTLQALIASYEIARNHRSDLADWEAEAELIKERPRRQRRLAARELRQMRPWNTHEAIETMRLSLASWCLLSIASFVAVLASVLELAT